VPVLAAAVVTLPSGQSRFAFPLVPRSAYVTGQQEPCTDCAAAGLSGQGVSRDGPGSAPLCLGCWRGRQRREPRRGSLSPEEVGWLAELEEQLACPACRPGAVPREVDLPPAAVAARRHQRRRDRARGRSGPTPRRTTAVASSEKPTRTGCWRCGEASWLASAREVFEADQERAAADAERVDELRAGQRGAGRRVVRARRRLAYVQAWHDRVVGVVQAMPKLTKTGSRGRLRLKAGPGAKARPVWLIADFLARMAAERAERGVTGRGRPSQHSLVVGVMAIAADPAAGKRSMAGLHPTAAFAGVTSRTVTNAWAYSEQVGATELQEEGRTCSLAEREETGLHRMRAVYDFTALHTSPFEPEPFLGAAAGVVATLLQRAVQLVDEHQVVLEEALREAAAAAAAVLDAQATVAERTAEDLLLQARVSDVWVHDARAAAKTARATRAAAPPADERDVVAASRAGRADRDQVVATVQTAFDLAIRMESFFYPPRMGLRERSSSGHRGLLFSAQLTSPVAGGQRPAGRGEHRNGGASRPSPTKGVPPAASSTHPRTPDRRQSPSPERPRRSADLSWAKVLVDDIARHWECVAHFLDESDDGGRRNSHAAHRERGLRRRQLAGIIAAQFSPDWRGHAGDLVLLVERYAGIHSIIAPGDAHSLLRYIKVMINRALTNPHAQVAHHSPVREKFEREVLAVDQAALAVARAVRQAELAARNQAAAETRAGSQQGLAALHTEMTRIRKHRRTASGHQRPDRDQDTQSADIGEAWTETAAQPGAGLPANWQLGSDRQTRRSPGPPTVVDQTTKKKGASSASRSI
jgi:hypothetical protein